MIGPFCGKMGGNYRQKMGPLYHTTRIQDTKNSKIPSLSSVPIRMSQSSSPFLREEIENLLNKRAVERVQNPGTPGFYSRIFLVPKKNGKLRLIIDLSLLNRYIKKQSFKMETFKSVRQAMRLSDWAVSIDLTDAYLHVPIHHQSGVVGWCEGAVYLTSPGRPTDIGLQLGKACYPCSG